MKGQMFLLTAGILIGVLVALRAFTTISQVTAEREILDVSVEDLAFKNIENEMKQVIGTVVLSPINMSDNIIDFINFTRVGTNAHGLDFTALFVSSLANSTNETINITVFQFLRETNLNVTVRLNTSTLQSNRSVTNDSQVFLSNFTFTRGGVYNLTVTFPDKGYEENITIKTRSNRDTYTVFYDIKLTSERATHAKKLQQVVRIP